MVLSVESQSYERSCVERLQAPRPIPIYGRIDRAHVIDSKRRVQPLPCADPERFHLRTTGAGRELCRCPKKWRAKLRVSQREDNYPDRPVWANESEAGRWLALAKGEGSPQHPLGDVPGLFGSSGRIRAVKLKGLTWADAIGLCRGRSWGSARPFR